MIATTTASAATTATALGWGAALLELCFVLLLRLVDFLCRRFILGLNDQIGFLFRDGCRQPELDGRGELGAFLRRFLRRAFDLERSGHQSFLRLEGNDHAVVALDAREFAALLVERIDRHSGRDADHHSRGLKLLTLFLKSA